MILVVHNQKGGVGKTTTAVHLAAALAAAGDLTCLIDSDVQGNATQGLGYERAPAVGRWLLDGAWQAVPARPRLDLLPGGTDDRLWWQTVTVERVQHHLATLTARYTWIVIDTPPGRSTWLLAVLQVADGVLVPVEPSFYALAAVLDTHRKVPPGRLIGIVPMRYDLRTRRSVEVLDQLKRLPGLRVSPPIRQCVDLDRASQAGLTIWEWAPHATAAEDYQTLAEWVVQTLAERT